jgi:predicted amidohydrolase
MIQENDLYYNRLIWMQPDGQYGYYDKAHLFSYGGENIDFTAGSKRLITSVKGWKICTMICYDLRFPVWNRMTSADEYDVLLFIANWPETRIQAWKTLLTARAIENQCFVIGLNRTGVDGNGLNYPGQSVIADPLGNLILNLEDKETADTLKLDRSVLETIRNRFPFQKDKDEFMLL